MFLNGIFSGINNTYASCLHCNYTVIMFHNYLYSLSPEESSPVSETMQN